MLKSNKLLVTFINFGQVKIPFMNSSLTLGDSHPIFNNLGEVILTFLKCEKNNFNYKGIKSGYTHDLLSNKKY